MHMHMCVCMPVHIHMRVCVCICTGIFVCVCVCTHTYIYVCMFARMIALLMTSQQPLTRRDECQAEAAEDLESADGPAVPFGRDLELQRLRQGEDLAVACELLPLPTGAVRERGKGSDDHTRFSDFGHF